MFSKEVLEENQKLEEQWRKRYAQLYAGKEFKLTTNSGIPVNPVYTAADLEGIDFKDIGIPGEYPFTRGIYPVHYQFQPWMNQLNLGYGLPEHARERMDFLRKSGMTGYFGAEAYNLPHDLVSKSGCDPDDPEARGLVGQGGVSVCDLDDIDRLFRDINLEKAHIVQNIGSATMAGLCLLLTYAESKGFAKEKMNGNSMNWLYKAPFVDYAMFPPQSAFMLMVEFIKYCSRNMPRWNTTNLCGYFVEEAGGTGVQEAAFTIATGIAIAEECVKIGLAPDDFLPRFGFQLSQSNDFFEEIARVRAIRRMWAKVTKERFGCKNPRSMQVRSHSHTSGCSLTAQQPMVNIIRATIHTLGAVLAGTNSIHTSAYDEALGIPTEESAELALRTQQVILHETNIPNVSDPLAGSYYVEWLTSEVEKEAMKLIGKIDEIGYIKCWEKGWFKQELFRSAYNWRESVDKGERIIVGLNKYQKEEEGKKVPVFQIDPRVEEIAVQRVREYRKNRDQAKVKQSLENLEKVVTEVKEEWPRGGDLMPAVVEAARAQATLGEMSGVLKKVFGWGYAY